MSFLSNLRNLPKSKSDCVIGGVCGGLGTYTPLPAWMWRAGFKHHIKDDERSTPQIAPPLQRFVVCPDEAVNSTLNVATRQRR